MAALIARTSPGLGPLGNASFQGNLLVDAGFGNIPGMFIAAAAGDAFEASPTGNAVVIDPAVLTFNPWGFVRIWDYSDPTNPVLASTFNTVNSLNEAGPPDSRGTYSVHNVLVEGDNAYLSWYADGVLVLDISDPYNPVEVARYHGVGPEFEAQNGGSQDVWGIYKEPESALIYASDRNGGLYVLTLPTPGDCSGDGGDPNIVDVLRLLRHIGDPAVPLSCGGGDCTGNGGDANIVDVLRLLRHLGDPQVPLSCRG